MNGASADRNLLFGILALQLDFIGRDALVAAMHAWVLAKQRPLGDILVEQGSLDAARHTLLESLVQEHLKQHGGDVGRSLAVLPIPSPLRVSLEKLSDTEVQKSLTSVPVDHPARDDPYATQASTGEALRACIYRDMGVKWWNGRTGGANFSVASSVTGN